MRSIALSTGGARYVEYLEQEVSNRSYWEGRGAQILEIEGEPVKLDQAQALSRGHDPKTGEILRTRMQNRSMYDLVIAAPKAVSIAGLMDDRIAGGHRECVALARRQIEGLAAAHTRIGGQDQWHWTGNLVQASYEHYYSRKADPHLHTHVLTMNLTYLPEAGEWRALNALPVYRNGFGVSENYRTNLADMLEQWGYKLDARLVDAERYPRNGERYPEDVGFLVSGITPAIEHRFSQRTQARDKDIAEFKERFGRRPTETEIDCMVSMGRKPKKEQVKLSPAELRELNLSRLTPAERDTLIRVRDEALDRSEKLGHRPTWIDPHLRESPEEKAEENQKHVRLHDPGNYEAPTQRRKWDYGADMRGPKVRM